MADLPILYSGPMVCAMLDDRKSQTRRALNPQPPEWATFCQQPSTLNVLHQWVPSGLWAWSEEEQTPPRALRRWPINADGEHYWLRPKFAKGDRLWVREKWRAHGWHGDCVEIAYAAQRGKVGWSEQHAQIPYPNGDRNAFKYYAPKGPDFWRPSIFMPRWASRLTLTVTDVRIERLCSISGEDAIAEGILPDPNRPGWWMSSTAENDRCPTPRDAYLDLWNSINGDGASRLDPWITAYTFTVERRNIDAPANVAKGQTDDQR